jgi:murein lipoprotein
MENMMKKSLLMISAMLALAFVVGGCATKGDLQEAQARDMAISAKADQAAQDAQAAKAAADEALLKANKAAARAEVAEKRAEERERIAAEKERIAEEKARQAEAIFKNSMKK